MRNVNKKCYQLLILFRIQMFSAIKKYLFVCRSFKYKIQYIHIKDYLEKNLLPTRHLQLFI